MPAEAKRRQQRLLIERWSEGREPSISETTTLFFKVDPQERRSRIKMSQKSGGVIKYLANKL